MAIYDFFLSRNNAASTPSNYIGHKGRLFYNDADGLFRLSDGVTPGGKIVANLALVSTGTTAPLNPISGELWYNPTTKEIKAYYNGSFRGTINVATTTTVGGIKAGPGVIIASDGSLSLDSSGIPFNFGDFYAFTNIGPSDGACLSSINLNQDINIVSNGTGTINVVGDFKIHKTDVDLETALQTPPAFSVSRTGITKILVPNTITSSGGVEIVGNSTGTFQTPVNTGVILHVTGNDPDGVATPSRIYNDGVTGYSGWIGRRYNGTAAAPTAVLNNDEVMRVGANAYKTGGWDSVGGANIRFVATNNQSTSTQGMKIDFYSTPQGTGTTGIVKVMTVDGSNGVTATRFNGPLTGVATTATNLASASSIVAGQVTINPAPITRGTASIQTVAINGLTTNHKILLMPATALTFGVLISAAWPSALNTVSIEFQNLNSTNDVDLGNIVLDFFAWI